MRLLIVEPNASGHHMALYVRLLVKESARRGWDVQLMTTRSTTEHPAMRLVDAEARGSLRVHLMPEIPAAPRRGPVGMALGQFSYYDALVEGFRKLPADAHPDIAYVINLDNVAKALAIRGSPFRGLPFSGMLMGLGYHRRAMQIGPTSSAHVLQRLMLRRILDIPSLQHVTVIDERLATYHTERPTRRDRKFKLVPDVGEISSIALDAQARRTAREALGIAPDRFTILLYGSLSLRKGIRELIDAVAACDDPAITVLLAGREDAEVRTYLAGANVENLRASGRLIVSPGFHGVAEEARVFAAADAVWVGYVDFFGSSGVLYQAGSAGRPVIASRGGLVGWIVQRYASGVVCDPRDGRAVAAAIAALRDSKSAATFAENGRRLAREHTESLFASAVCDTLEQGIQRNAQ